MKEEKKRGIMVTYKNGTKDWYDPVIMEEKEGENLKVTIENGNTYNVYLPDIQSVSYYEL